MRILLDLQGCQTPSRLRGIGRYSMALARGILRNNTSGHDIYVGVSNGAPETIGYVKDALADLLPTDRFKVWASVYPTESHDARNAGRLARAQVLREAFIAGLRPDIVHCSSVVEGFHDNAVTSIGLHVPQPPTVATLYDLIPALDPDRYLPFPWVSRWYRNALGSLRRADLLLAISESAAREGVEVLGVPAERIVNIRAAADDMFAPRQLSPEEETRLRTRWGLQLPFLLYSGGLDARKNVDGLIRAFAALPADVREAHQVAIVGPTYTGASDQLLAVARECGLRDGQVVVTGYVDDDDIVSLYNLAVTFVFPSHHEGFGLPPLEAMRCGTPTIAADNSSIPEVVANPEALFDSRDAEEMTAKLHRVLTDADFRGRLREAGLAQAATFNWDDTARRALASFEELHARTQERRPAPTVASPWRPRLALVTGLPPRGSSARKTVVDLVEQLDRHYRVDLVTTAGDMPVHELEMAAGLVDATEFATVAGRYDRVLYRYTNSPESGFVLGLQALHPGTVLLEDLYLDEALPALPVPTKRWQARGRALVGAYGYAELYRHLRAVQAGRTPPRLTLTGEVLRHANGVMVTDPRIAERLIDEHGETLTRDLVVVPVLRPGTLRIRAPRVPPTTVASFGPGGTRQQLHRLVAAWLESNASADPEARLVLAGQDPDDPYGRFLASLLAAASRPASWAFVPESEAEAMLSDVRFAVQLSAEPNGRFARWTALCHASGVPVVANGSSALAADFTQQDLIAALDTAWSSPPPTTAASSGGDPGDAYVDAIERLHRDGPLARQAATLRLAATADGSGDAADATALALAWNDPNPAAARQLLLDVSNLVIHDARTGIQRVVRNIARHLALNPPANLRVEPVFADDEGRFRYARTYTAGLLGLGDLGLADSLVAVAPGDIFVGLDPSTRLFAEQIAADGKDIVASEGSVAHMRASGVNVQFVVYDLIPLSHPEWFPGDLSAFPDWFRGIVRRGDGLVAISRSTADDVSRWIRDHLPDADATPVSWFHMGADIDSESARREPSERFLDRWNTRGGGLTLAMVGTVEPRKGHQQVLDAFERLWAQGVAANLVIVGRYGWGEAGLANRIRNHPQAAAGRLRWFEDASDADLDYVYSHADGCLVASKAEGFGLPLIEAARHGIPIMARDLPVFREVAGDHADYFSGEDATALADALSGWLLRLREGSAPDSAAMPWNTWEDSARAFMAAVLRNIEAPSRGSDGLPTSRRRS